MRILLLLTILLLPALNCAAQDRIIRNLPPNTVVAVIDGVEIKASEIDTIASSQDARKVFELNQQLFELRESILMQRIEERLLKKETEDKGFASVDAYMESLALPVISEAHIDLLVQQAVAQNAPKDVETLRKMAREHLTDRAMIAARQKRIKEIKDELKKKGKPVVMKLPAPRMPMALTQKEPTKGTGKVEIVEFSDFECSYCQKAQPILRNILAKYDGKVKLVWKDMPLPMHENAVIAAQAGRCADQQGKFWQYHDVLFANQHALGRKDLHRHAEAVGLNAGTFEECMKNDRSKEITSEAMKAPVRATPTFFINGRMIEGVELEKMEQIIEAELEVTAN